MMCQEEKDSTSITRLRNSCLITFFKKNTEAATGCEEAVTGGVL